LQGFQHHLQAHSNRQDDGPEIAFSAIVPTAFIESGKEDFKTGPMQSEKVIFSWLTDEFLIKGYADQFASLPAAG
jgi:hypothetical protein